MKDVRLTTRELITHTAERLDRAELFFGHGSAEPLDEAIHLALHCLAIPYNELDEKLDQLVATGPARRLRQLTEIRCRTRKPTAYLTCTAWFAGLEFYVDERALIPRSPIAELIAQRFSPWLAREATHILDVGTGSACIAIACAQAFPAAQVDALDISSAALAVATHNCSLHQAGQRVRLHRSDLFEAIGANRYDLIIANAPYVDAADLGALPREYHYEPRSGFDGGGDGLLLTRRILALASGHLTPGGVLIGEVGGYAELLTSSVPGLPFLWVDLEHGGEGVFALFADDLASAGSAL